MTRANRKNAFKVSTTACSCRSIARNYEALSKTRYNSVRISNCGPKFLQYPLNILYFRIEQNKNVSIFSPQVTRLFYLKVVQKSSFLYEEPNSRDKRKFQSEIQFFSPGMQTNKWYRGSMVNLGTLIIRLCNPRLCLSGR